MADIYDPTRAGERPVVAERADNPVWQAYQALHVAFVVIPIVAGVDKFFMLLAQWHEYLAPVFPSILGVSDQTFMYGVGAIEIAAGIIVAFWPRIGAYVVSAWLGAIIVNLLIVGGYGDIVLRDLGLMIGAFALGRLAQTYHRVHDVTP